MKHREGGKNRRDGDDNPEQKQPTTSTTAKGDTPLKGRKIQVVQSQGQGATAEER